MPEASNEHLIYGEKLVKTYKGRTVVDQVSINVDSGEVVVNILLGESAATTVTVDKVGGFTSKSFTKEAEQRFRDTFFLLVRANTALFSLLLRHTRASGPTLKTTAAR